jgi:hypothetical protein
VPGCEQQLLHHQPMSRMLKPLRVQPIHVPHAPLAMSTNSGPVVLTNIFLAIANSCRRSKQSGCL